MPLPGNRPRYAIYFAPPPESDLWRFGCDVIGHDALTGAAREGFAPEGYTPSAWRKITTNPRRYGFHTTLKAPFRLRLDLDLADLIKTLVAFSRRFAPFEAGELAVGPVAFGSGPAFVALEPKGDLNPLRAFEASVVRALDHLRAPLELDERERRMTSRLTPRQAYYLDAWGYPYVLDEYRPHFTLTNAVADAERIARQLQHEFAFRVAAPALRIDALALFGESEQGGEFKLLRRFPLGRANRSAPTRARILTVAAD